MVLLSELIIAFMNGLLEASAAKAVIDYDFNQICLQLTEVLPLCTSLYSCSTRRACRTSKDR
jgi:hypothetical protein